MNYKNLNIQKSIIFQLIFSCSLSLNVLSQGLNINRIEGQNIPLATNFSYKSLNLNLPLEYSLIDFVPDVINQGNFNTCVPISTLYYAAGIRLSFLLNVKNKYLIQKELSLAPLYNWQLAGFECSTSQGTGLYDMALDLNSSGGIPFEYFPYLSCIPITSNSAPRIYAQKIQKFCEWNSILKKCVSNDDILNNLKFYIYSGFPIVVGIPSDNLPSYTQNKSKYHVITLIGWNNKGFIFVNSWGQSWANKGFGSLDYDTIRKNILGAFCFDLDLSFAKSITDKFESQQNPTFEMTLNRIIKNRDSNGSIEQTKQKEIPILNLVGYYSIKLGNLASLNEYQFEYKHFNKYIKIYTLNPKNNMFTLLDFKDPNNLNYSESILPSQNSTYKFLGQGSDYLVVLISDFPIHEPIFPDFSKNTDSSNIPIQLVKVFGKNPNMLKNKIGIENFVKPLALIIEIEH